MTAVAQARRPRPAACDVAAVLGGDAGQAAVRRLVLDGVGPGRLPAAVQACLPPATPGSSRLLKTHFKPGRRLTAYYELRVDGDPAGSRCAAVTWSPGDPPSAGPGAGAATELEEEAARRGVRRPFSRLSRTDLPDQRRVTVSPLDADFPQLVRLSDRSHLAQALAAAGLPGGHTQPGALRYRPGQRHVLRLSTGDGTSAPLYAKLYRTGQLPAPDRLAAVVEHLRGAAPAVALVLPAAELVDDQTLVWHAVHAVPLADLAVRGHLPSFAQAGAALRALHEVPAQAVSHLPRYELGGELRTVRSAATHLAVLCPDVAARAAAVLAAVEEQAGRLPPEAESFLHGDVKAEHVLLGAGAACWLDLERCSVGDPALDLGKLLADVRWRLDAGHPSRVRQAQAALLSGYGAGTGERAARARLLEPLFLVRFAARRVELHEPRWRRRVDALVTAAARLLVPRQVR